MHYTWSGKGNLSVTTMGAHCMQKTRSRRSVKYISSSFWIQPQTSKPSTTTSTNKHSSLPELNHGLDRRYEPSPTPRTNPTMDENHFRADIVVKGHRQHVSDQDLPESWEERRVSDDWQLAIWGLFGIRAGREIDRKHMPKLWSSVQSWAIPHQRSVRVQNRMWVYRCHLCPMTAQWAGHTYTLSL